MKLSFVWALLAFVVHASTWEPVGLSGGGAIFAPGISEADPNLMLVNCDMSAAYLSEDGGRNWRMLNHAQLRSDTTCRPAFHPTDRNIIYASSAGRLKKSVDAGKTFQAIGGLRESVYGEIRINPSNPAQIIVGTRNGHSFISNDSGATWELCKGPSGQIIRFHFKGKTIYAATNKGLWRSDDGVTWSDLTSQLPGATLQAFAGAASMLYCAVPSRIENGAFAGGIYRSRDGGKTWKSAMGAGINVETKKADEYAPGPTAQYKLLLAADKAPLTVYAFNTSTGFHPPHHETVYRSDDGGDTWRATFYQDPRFKDFNAEPDYEVASTGQSFKGGGVPFGVAICNSDPNRVLLVENVAYVTHDGGKTWLNGSTRPAPGQTAKPGAQWVCNDEVVTTTWHYYVDPLESNRHYIAYTDIGFARSIDAGKTWIWWDKRSWAPWRNTCYELAFDPETPGLIWGAFSNVHDIPNDNIISEHHGHNGPGGICVSHDFGASWQAEAKGLPLNATTSVVIDSKSPKDARTLYAGVFDHGVFKSTNGGKNWTAKNSGLGDAKNMRVSRVFLHSDGTLFALVCAKRLHAGQPLMPEGVGLYRSKDGAETWEKLNRDQTFLYPKDFSVDPKNSNRILLGACDAGGGDQSGGLYETKDAGKTWERIGRKGPQTFGGYFHPQHPNWIYMTLTEGAPGDGLWFSDDDGKTWRGFDDLPFANIQRVQFDPEHEDTIYLATFGGSVWKGPARPK